MKPFSALIIILLLSSSVSAKDLYVSPSGDDSVTYANNSINNPWQTVAYAWTHAQSGDIVYYRAGTYRFTSTLNYYPYADNVTHKNYNNETVSWTSSLTGSTVYVDEPYITVDGINIDASALADADDGFFNVGYTRSATNFTLKNSVVTVGAASDNAGVVYARSETANYITVENCKIQGEGPDAGSGNTSGIWVDRLQYATFKNNEIYNVQTGIYFKHSNARTPGTGPTIENNYIHDCGRAAILIAFNYGTVRNNLFVNANVVSGMDGGTGSGGTGSDYNTFNHNTFYNSQWRSYCPSSAGDSGATNNTVTNNVFYGRAFGPEFESPECAENMYLTTNYNLYPTPTAVAHRSENYTLANWRTLTGGDADSLSATPFFVGAKSPVTVADYALAAGSPGLEAASSGGDMGADVEFVAVRAMVGGRLSGSMSGGGVMR